MNKEGKLLWVLIALFLLIGGWYSVAIPLGEGVDEVPHFDYVRYVKENHALPIQPWQDNGRPLLVSMGHHPPLYYVLNALVIAGINTDDFSTTFIPNPHFEWGGNYHNDGWNVYLHPPVQDWPWRNSVLAMHLVRFTTLLLGAITLYATYQIGTQLFPNTPWIPLTSIAWLAFNPSFVFMASTVHHDTLMAAVFTLGLWWLSTLSKTNLSPQRGVIGGLLLGAAMLTKLSGFSLVAVYGLTFAYFAFRNRSLKTILPCAGSTFLIAFMVAGWWYLRNWYLYDDLLGWGMFRNIHAHMLRQGSFTWDTFTHEFLYQLGQTFWGAYGYMHIVFPEDRWLNLWKGAAILCLIAVGVIWHKRKSWFTGKQLEIWGILGNGLLWLFLSFVSFAMSTSGAGHARYLFGGVTIFVLLLAIGSHALTCFKYQPIITLVITIGLAAYSILLPVKYILPLYPSTNTFIVSQLPNETTITNIHFGQDLTLVGYKIGTPNKYGQTDLELYWQTDSEHSPDLYVNLYLRQADNTLILQYNFWPIPSFSTVGWEPHTIYISQRTLQIPPGTPPSELQLGLTITEGRNGIALTPKNAKLINATEAVVAVLQLQSTVVFAEEIKYPRADVFEANIELLGYNISPPPYRAGQALDLTLYWRSKSPIQQQLVVFVHVLNSEGQLVAQHDSAPNQGRAPTTLWQPGTIVTDLHPIVLTENLPSGTYTLSIGIYDWPSIQKLKISGGPFKDKDALIISTIELP